MDLENILEGVFQIIPIGEDFLPIGIICNETFVKNLETKIKNLFYEN